jgi:hypothetical protein
MDANSRTERVDVLCSDKTGTLTQNKVNHGCDTPEGFQKYMRRGPDFFLPAARNRRC